MFLLAAAYFWVWNLFLIAGQYFESPREKALNRENYKI